MANPIKRSPASLSGIYRFRTIGSKLGTAGQPTEEQLRMVREAGFEVVINLALPTSDRALANEGSIVASLGMAYVHIPVDFRAPASQPLHLFYRVMEAVAGRSVFVHCAANKRVSAFVFLHRVLHRRATLAEAARDLHAVWTPDPVWNRFMQQELKGYRTAVGRRRILTVGT